jgi:hypothetical protein
VILLGLIFIWFIRGRVTPIVQPDVWMVTVVLRTHANCPRSSAAIPTVPKAVLGSSVGWGKIGW